MTGVQTCALPIFPLLAEEIGAAFPGVALVDGGAGIARRIAHLTRGQNWPDAPPPGIALFTGPAPSPRLAASLADFGLTQIVTL